jgi:hypothetical protein
VNNFKAIGKLAWHLAGAPGTFCVERTPEGRKEIKASNLRVNVANPAMSLNFVEWVGSGERGREKDKRRMKGSTEEDRFYSGSSE